MKGLKILCRDSGEIIWKTACLNCEKSDCKLKGSIPSYMFDRKSLYKDYLSEIEDIRGEKFSEPEEEKNAWCDDYMIKSYYTWIDIRYLDQIVGFLIIGTRPDCHPQCDYFIAQSYIRPGYRKRGLMTDAVTKYVDEHPGKYCMIILEKNTVAELFWSNLFKDLSYESFDIYDIGCLHKGEVQLAFKPDRRVVNM